MSLGLPLPVPGDFSARGQAALNAAGAMGGTMAQYAHNQDALAQRAQEIAMNEAFRREQMGLNEAYRRDMMQEGRDRWDQQQQAQEPSVGDGILGALAGGLQGFNMGSNLYSGWVANSGGTADEIGQASNTGGTYGAIIGAVGTVASFFL